jgi:nitric oxide reductase NorE protein
MQLDTGEGILSLTTAPARAEPDRLPGDSGVWVFITADTFFFGLFFLLFSLGRSAHVALYERSRLLLNPMLGLVNTLVLLTSSWFMVRAVGAAREGARGRVLRNIALAMAVGSVFAATKVFEYTTKIQAGITMLTNEFFTYYFVFTGVHFLHYLIGMVVLMICFHKARTQSVDGRYVVWIESSGCYWHMVDLLWVVLFPLLYLLRAT